jgi:hypothetical protein
VIVVPLPLQIHADAPGRNRQHHTVDKRASEELGEFRVSIGIGVQVVSLVKHANDENCLAVRKRLLPRHFPKVQPIHRRQHPDWLYKRPNARPKVILPETHAQGIAAINFQADPPRNARRGHAEH